MKTVFYKPGISFIVIVMLAAGLVRCGHGHHREERKIRKERVAQNKETADVGEAVKATDEAGWDSTTAYRQFQDTEKVHLDRNSRTLEEFSRKLSRGRKKVPLRYRGHIQELKKRNEALKQRLARGPVAWGQAAWTDYVRLYNYDMQRLERDIHRLTGYQP